MSQNSVHPDLRVLFVNYYIDDPSIPGFAPKYELLSQRWRGDIFHLAPQTGDLQAGRFTFRGCAYRRESVLMRQWSYLKFCLRKARELGPYDVIISYDPMICGFISVFLKYILKAKLVIEVNTDHFFRLPTETDALKDRFLRWVKQGMMRFSFRAADAVKFVNSQLARDYGHRFSFTASKPVQGVFFSYIATEAFIPKTENDSDQVLLMVGHPFVVKGVDVLLKAFNRISADYPEVHLKIIGMCENLDDYRALVLDPDRVTFLPGISHKQIAVHFQQCLFYVMSSRTEGIPRVLVEAMACGKAAIGSRAGGIPDVIVDGETGLLFESENDQDLADKMRILLDNPELCAKFGQAGLQRSQEVFSPQMYVNRYFRFMDKVLERHDHR